jgi:hypothetical protein
MKLSVLFVSASLLLGSGLVGHASPVSLTPVNEPVVREQAHLQSASSQMRRDAIREGDLPMEFKKPSGPRGHNLINLNF